MSYTTENAKDYVAREMLVLMRPRIRTTTWTQHSGDIYFNSFTYGYVTAVSVNGTALAAGSSASLSAGEFYYDPDTPKLYLRKSSGTPQASDWIVVTFELYLATKELNWYRDPTDSTSRPVCWRGVIRESPVITRSVRDAIFGFSPVNATGITCTNDREYFQSILHDISLNLADVVVYHLAGRAITSNFQKIFTGVGGDYSFDDKTVSFSILDKSYRFDKRMDNGNDATEWNAPGGAVDSDPSVARSAIRTIYGAKKGVRGICITANWTGGATAKQWAVQTAAWGKSQRQFTVLADGSNTFTVSLADAAVLWEIWKYGYPDWINGVWGGGGAFRNITNVNKATGVVTYDGADTNLNPASPDMVSNIGNQAIGLLQNGLYFAYTGGLNAGETALFHADFCGFISGAESGVPGTDPDTVNPNVDIFFTQKALGALIAPTINGSTFGAFGNPVVVLYHILKDRLGMAESEIDTDAFLACATSQDFRVAMSTIDDDGDSQPVYRDVINRLLTTALLQAYIDENGKFTIAPIGPCAADPDFSIQDSDLLGPQFSISYRDITSVRVVGQKINYWPVSPNGTAPPTTAEPYSLENDKYEIDETVEMSAQAYLHQVENQRQIDTYFCEHDGSILTAAEFATRISQILGERRGYIQAYVKVGLHGANIGDTIEVESTKLDGYAYDGETTNTRKYKVVEISKELGGVRMLLDDQKGIEDNTGDW